MMTKDELLEQIDIDRRQLERYLFYFEKNADGEFVPGTRNKLRREKMLQPGVAGKLSVKDVLDLISGWESHFIEWYRQAKFGEQPSSFSLQLAWEDREQINKAILAAKRTSSLDDSLINFRSSFQQMRATIKTLPEEELTSTPDFARDIRPGVQERIDEVTWRQYRWAKEHIRTWSRKGGRKGMDKAGILNRIQTERRRLEKNLENISDQEMVEPSVIDMWTIKDLLAHLVDWEQRFLGWYQAGLRGEIPQTPAPGMTWKDMDKLNQMIYEEHKDQPLSAVKLEFQASYQQVLQMVETIPEEDIFPVGRYAWTGNSNLAIFILANTANHYRWAKTQIRRWMSARR